MIHSFKYFAKSAVIVLNIVLIFTVSSYGSSFKTFSPNQIRKSKKAKTKSKIKMSEPLTGEWSGKHITIKFTGQGADIEYDCAHGAINQKIIPDKQNRFSAAGTYTEEHGGPVRADEQPGSVAVKYIGQINGKKMKLTVKQKDDGTVVGNFTLFRGQESLLVKCL